MASLRHHLIWTTMRLTRFRYRMGKDLAKNRAQRTEPAGALKYKFTRENFDGHPIWRISPRGKPRPAKTLYHLHGGGHVYGMLPLQFPIWADLAARANAEVIAPCYPLPPDFTAPEVNEFCSQHFERLIAEKGLDNITLSGDSAGAQLALTLAMNRRDVGQALPQKLILWSPWVDLSMTNPDIKNYLSAAILEPKSLKAAGLRFAGPLDVKDPQVSPLYGDLTGLPDLHVFTGGRDLLYPDIMKFCDKAKLEGVNIHVTIEPELGHYWMFLPQPEAKKTLIATAALIE